jgi:hypothetical protein
LVVKFSSGEPGEATGNHPRSTRISGNAGAISPIMQRDQFGDAGGALATFDFDHHVIVDPQAIGRDILYLCDAGAAPDP